MKAKLETLLGSMPTNSPMPSPDINAPSPSTSSVSIEDINVQNISFDQNFDNLSNVSNYVTNSSLKNSNNEVDVYVPTTVVSNKPHVAPESFNAVQGIFNLLFSLFFIFF